MEKKLAKIFKPDKNIAEYLYYKGMGGEWKKESELEKTLLIDLQIESGTIFLFLSKL